MKGVLPLPSTILAGRELGKAQEIIDDAEKGKAEILAPRPMMKKPARCRFLNAHSKRVRENGEHHGLCSPEERRYRDSWSY
jgi:hypothetical protein